ncbi:unnamed protein product [Linum tenue]|uniref:Uncharacterized protein n=1 Tax=Linum tenue TaxID=586396 RepID=A0AAV0JIC5_9ROSI|nr:unnamed protein product [Linum tenue]
MVISRKKLQSILRCAMVMIRKGVSNSKTKLALDLHLIIQRGKDLVTQHQISPPAGCRPDDPEASFLSPISCGAGHVDVRLSYVSPRDYQFSCCSNSPSSAAARRRRPPPPRKPYRYNHHYRQTPQARYYNHGDVDGRGFEVAESCAATSTVGGCSSALSSGEGSWSPLVREVRITDSPFSSMRGGGTAGAGHVEGHVDTEAERFIQRFYTDLRLQKWMAAAGYHEQKQPTY